MPEFCLARETAEHLGGADLLGCEVRSEADLAEVIESGLPTESLRSWWRPACLSGKLRPSSQSLARCRIGEQTARG